SSSTIHRGSECSISTRSRSPAGNAGSRWLCTLRSTAFANPASFAPPTSRAADTASSTAAYGGTRSRNSSWYAATRNAVPTRGGGEPLLAGQLQVADPYGAVTARDMRAARVDREHRTRRAVTGLGVRAKQLRDMTAQHRLRARPRIDAADARRDALRRLREVDR